MYAKLGNQSRALASIILDTKMLQVYPGAISWHFIVRKYLLVVRDSLVPFKEGRSCLRLFGRPYYYASKFGVGFLQDVFMEDAFLRNYVQPGATVVDVGGNIGQFNIFARVALQAGRILSFEPLPSCAALLRRNADESYETAITTAKEVKMHYGDSTLTATAAAGVGGSHEVAVAGMRLDAHPKVRELETIDLLKIDTEGTELDVLRSAEGIMDKVRFVLIEASVTRPNSGDIREVIDYLGKQKPAFRLAATGVNYMGPVYQTEACDLFFVREGELEQLKAD